MKALVTGFLMAIWAMCSCFAGEAETAPLQLDVKLVDGSRIFGTTGLGSVGFQTSYAKMSIPLNQILSLRIGEDREMASMDLTNGDRLKGVVNLEPIKLTTIFGQVSLGIQHVREIHSITAGGTLPAALKRDLVLYYSFDRNEAGEVSDSSGMQNTGKVQGAEWIADGKRGGAYLFSGGNDCILASRAVVRSMRAEDDRTFSLWWKAEKPLNHKTLLGQLDTVEGVGFALMVLQDEYYLPSIVHHYGKFATQFEQGKWHHFVVVKKGTSWRVFHNGQERSVSDSGNWPLTDDVTAKAELQIGNTLHSKDTGFEGAIDEVAVFTRALTDDEVRQIYDAQK